MPTAKKTQLGPGTLTLGEVASPIDISCQIISAMIEWEKDKDDDVTVLCGEVVAGSTTYSASITGELFQDVDDPAGILATSWAQKGEETPFTFVPNTAAGTEVEGILVLDPISFGGDEAKANMTSDFTWSIVGEPTLTIGSGGALAADTEARGARREDRGRGVTVEVLGADRLASTLADAATELRAMAATNRAVASAILAAAHPPIRTGALASSLTADGTDTEATVTSSLRYAPIQEARRGFLSAALTATEGRAVSLHLDHVNEALGKVRGV